MIRRILFILVVMSIVSSVCAAQELSPKWEELTAPDFVKAIQQAKGTCMLPFGIVEKHGPSGPLGTDLLNVRYLSLQAVKQEYAVVFPEYYFGQIFEARQQPGTLAYSTELQLKLLTETTREMARNGCKKILIVNGHGGNISLLQYFGQIQLESPRDYVVYSYIPEGWNQKPTGDAAPSHPGVDGHAGEDEMSQVMVHRPELVHPDRGASQSGADQARLKDLPSDVYVGIWWYARFPNHYEGDASASNAKRGQALTQLDLDALVNVIRKVKADEAAAKLMKQFYDDAKHPIDTKQ